MQRSPFLFQNEAKLGKRIANRHRPSFNVRDFIKIECNLMIFFAFVEASDPEDESSNGAMVLTEYSRIRIFFSILYIIVVYIHRFYHPLICNTFNLFLCVTCHYILYWYDLIFIYLCNIIWIIYRKLNILSFIDWK